MVLLGVYERRGPLSRTTTSTKEIPSNSSLGQLENVALFMISKREAASMRNLKPPINRRIGEGYANYRLVCIPHWTFEGEYSTYYFSNFLDNSLMLL